MGNLSEALRDQVYEAIYEAHLDALDDDLYNAVMNGHRGLINMSDEELMDDLALICGEDSELFLRCEADLAAQSMLDGQPE